MKYVAVCAVTRFNRLTQLMNYGILDKERAMLTLCVYLDLTESKCWWNVAFVPSVELKSVLLIGRLNEDTPEEIIMPVSTNDDLSVSRLQAWLTVLEKEHTSISVSLAICEADSSIVYYRLMSGLQPPQSPDLLEETKARKERQFQQRRKQIIQYSTAREAIEAAKSQTLSTSADSMEQTAL